MARYGDLDALLENLKKQYGEELGWQCTVNMSDVGMMIEDAPTADVAQKSEVAREIIAEIDNRLHDMAMEYHNAGHPEYFAVCEMVYHKVIRAVEKKYKGQKE